MSRLVLAFKLFFLVIFNGGVYEAVREAYERVRSGGTPVAPSGGKGASQKASRGNGSGKASARAPVEPPSTVAPAAALLALLQREARFVDFLMEDIDGFPDAQVGALAKTVHSGCRKALEEYVELAPVRSEKEGAPLTLETGFDAYAIRITGNIAGDPPFKGTLVHPGWRVAKANLPVAPPAQDASIVMPAEVEIQ